MKTLSQSRADSQEDLLYHDTIVTSVNARAKWQKINRLLRCQCCLIGILLLLNLLWMGTVGAAVVVGYGQVDKFLFTLDGVDRATRSVQEASKDVKTITPIVQKFANVDLSEWNSNINSISDIDRAMRGYDLQIAIIKEYLKRFDGILKQVMQSLGLDLRRKRACSDSEESRDAVHQE